MRGRESRKYSRRGGQGASLGAQLRSLHMFLLGHRRRVLSFGHRSDCQIPVGFLTPPNAHPLAPWPIPSHPP